MNPKPNPNPNPNPKPISVLKKREFKDVDVDVVTPFNTQEGLKAAAENPDLSQAIMREDNKYVIKVNTNENISRGKPTGNDFHAPSISSKNGKKVKTNLTPEEMLQTWFPKGEITDEQMSLFFDYLDNKYPGLTFDKLMSRRVTNVERPSETDESLLPEEMMQQHGNNSTGELISVIDKERELLNSIVEYLVKNFSKYNFCLTPSNVETQCANYIKGFKNTNESYKNNLLTTRVLSHLKRIQYNANNTFYDYFLSRITKEAAKCIYCNGECQGCVFKSLRDWLYPAVGKFGGKTKNKKRSIKRSIKQKTTKGRSIKQKTTKRRSIKKRR